MAIPQAKCIYEKFFHHSPDLLCVIDREGYFVEVSQACERILDYRRHELAGKPYLEYMMPEDREHTKQAMKQVMYGVSVPDLRNRYRHKNGTEVLLSWSLAWSEEEVRFYCLARNTAQPHLNAGLTSQVHRTMLEAHPDGIFWESSDGYITEVNEAFCRIMGSPKTDLLGSSVSSFLPHEMAAANHRTLQEALQGSTRRLTLELGQQAGEHRVFDAMKQPIIVDSHVLGVQTTLKDITPLLRSHGLIAQQATKLHTIFESITDGFLLLDRDWNFSYFNTEAGRLLSLDHVRHTGRNAWEVFPSEVNGVFYKHYHHAAATGKPVSFEAYFALTDKWFNVKAFPSDEGISVYFSDITDMFRTRQELNKLSLVASKTTNGVIITDNQLRIDWVNDSFTKITGFSLAESTGHTPFELLRNPREDRAAMDAFQDTALQGEAVSFEVLRRKKDGTDIWLLVQITPVKDEEDNITHFLFVQSDISERVKTKEKLEMLSLVASKTINSVIIMDAKARVEWVNDSFTHLTGYTLDETAGKRPLHLLQGEDTDKATVRRIAESIKQAYPFQEEILIYTKSGEKKWFTNEVTPIMNEEGRVVRRIGIQTDITEMVRAREELKKLALVASRTNSSVLIADKDWRVEWVNDGFTRLMGYRLQEAAGKQPSELLHNHKTDKTAFLAQEAKLIAGQPISFEVLNVKKDRSEVWINAEITPVFDNNGGLSKFIEVQTDITALKTSEQELKKLALVASGTDNGVVITDAQGLTEWVNEGFTRITGYTLPDLAGKEPGAVLRGPETDQATVEKIYDHLKRGDTFSAELLNYKKSGEKYWTSMDVNPIYDDHGRISNYIVIQRDVTYKKKAEATLLKMTEDLYARNSDLQQFTYIVSHNLRAPVANALGLASLMTKTDKASPTFDQFLVHLKTSLLRMDTVLRDVNTILSIREAQPVHSEERVLLVDVVRQVYDYLQEPLHRLKAEVCIDVDEDISVSGNKAYLFSVFYNLMTNAIKYRSLERPLEIKVQHQAAPAGCLIVSFADNGIGIDMQQAEGSIFGLYKRFHKDIEGKGMGLFLVKTHLEAMGGSIKVESEVGVGTEFKIQLPL